MQQANKDMVKQSKEKTPGFKKRHKVLKPYKREQFNFNKEDYNV